MSRQKEEVIALDESEAAAVEEAVTEVGVQAHSRAGVGVVPPRWT